MQLLYLCIGIFAFFFLLNKLLARYGNPYGITFIAAEIGAGKSCYAAKMAKKHLKKGWTVYSTDYIKGCNQITVKELCTHVCPPRSLVIIDEAALKFNSRSFKTVPMELLRYMKLCRHYKNKVVMISQTFGDTDKQIRELSSRIFIIRNILSGLISMPIRIRGRIGVDMNGDLCVQYRVGRIAMPFLLPRYFKLYNSFNSDVEYPLVDVRRWEAEAAPAASAVATATRADGDSGDAEGV